LKEHGKISVVRVSIDDAITQQLAGMTEQMEDQQREKDDATKQLTESAVKLDSERRAKDNATQQLAESKLDSTTQL
jgi:hypothetical protein